MPLSTLFSGFDPALTTCSPAKESKGQESSVRGCGDTAVATEAIGWPPSETAVMRVARRSRLRGVSPDRLSPQSVNLVAGLRVRSAGILTAL